MISRRNFARMIGVGALGALIRPHAYAKQNASRPRYFLSLYIGGGIDQILTTDPKRKTQVDRFVDRPYRDQDIITEGGIQIGPVLAPMARHAKRLTIINGVLTATVSHQTGALQHVRLKIGSDLDMPTAADLIGAYRDTQALASVTLGDIDEFTYSSTWFGSGARPGEQSLIDELSALSKDELVILADEADRAGRSLGKADARTRVAADNMTASATFMRRLASTPRFVEEKWADEPITQWYAKNLQQSLWLFKHDLCRAVYLRTNRAIFDTHSNNTELQLLRGKPLFEMIARFLDVVERETLANAPASQQLLFLAGSEVGRHPRLNSNAGKDHFPEAPVIMYGGGLRPGQFVDTGRQTEAFPVDLETGRRKKGGHVVTLDDIGATVLELAGVDRQRHTHTGTPLPFVLAR